VAAEGSSSDTKSQCGAGSQCGPGTETDAAVATGDDLSSQTAAEYVSVTSRVASRNVCEL